MGCKNQGLLGAKATGLGFASSPLKGIFRNCPILLKKVVNTTLTSLEPISKSFEEDDETGELHEAKEVLRIKLPADKNAALPLNPGEEPFD